MSWNDFYARRDAMDAVLKLARRDPAAPLPYAEVPRTDELFGSPQQLLLALNYRWMQHLGGHLRATVGGPEDVAEAPPQDISDNPELVAAAWRKAVAEQPTLRAVLDANVDRFPAELVPAVEREQRMLALTAGLADPFEPVEEITRIGASFMALLRHGRTTTKRRSPAGQLLRLLSPAS